MNELGRQVAELVEQLGERRREYGELKRREEHLLDALRGALEALQDGRAICRLHADTLSLAQDRQLGEKVSCLRAEIARLESDIQTLIDKAGGEPANAGDTVPS